MKLTKEMQRQVRAELSAALQTASGLSEYDLATKIRHGLIALDAVLADIDELQQCLLMARQFIPPPPYYLKCVEVLASRCDSVLEGVILTDGLMEKTT